MVHQIYGIPMGDIPMSNPSKSNPENHVVKLWKSQFPITLKRIRLTNVVEMIRNDTTAGPIVFLLLFYVHFTNVEDPPIQSSTKGLINWTSKMLKDRQLQELSKGGFGNVFCFEFSCSVCIRDDRLFYVHFTNVEDRPIQSSTKGLINWTSKMLKDRQLQELSKGGFGNVTISSQHIDMSHCEQVSKGFTENVVQQILGKCDDSNSIEEIISEINLNFNTYHNAKRDIDKWLLRGVRKFPDSEALLQLVTKRNHEFNLACPKISTSDDFHDPTLFNGVLTPVMHDGSNTTESKHAQIQKETVQDEVLDEIVFATPFSQLLDAEAFDIMEKAALAACSKTSKQESVSPDHRGSQLIINVGNVDPVTVVAPRRTKRHVQPTEKFRSPYFKRVVNPNKLLTSNEERVSGWIFVGLDNEWDLVFESIFGDLGYRGIFESMIPGSKIHATCIDIWASILNHQERYRNKKSPARMFLSCTLLVFFPVIDIEHYYLVVFDFKKHDCVIIDNINSKESDEGKYGNIPYDLKILFTLYVDELNHKKANHIKRAKPMSGCMKWTTKYNSIDCGVFLMRHMETYKGEDLDKWDIGFEPEYKDNDDQQNQLDEMRIKYVTKILTWDLNVVKPSIYTMLGSYDRLSDADKESFNTEEHLLHIERRISLFY
ncbi:hypothetical protein L2E82_38279 [Cichorium intybus]|uniref:Uncharacterized protein n=1 Tax=Cichorium intybus TaxID=13427 RepID=A0ACB9AG34_CICIN|nr:hypothetical protein L2E82_38279 [Cichorium intybus]